MDSRNPANIDKVYDTISYANQIVSYFFYKERQF